MGPLFSETKNSVLDKKISRLNRREKKRQSSMNQHFEYSTLTNKIGK
jgi:hypothetical protein